MARKKKFTKTLIFRIFCIIIIILFLGIAYNFVVRIGKKPQKSEEQQQAELQEKASRDTIDIIGDYLWGSSRPKDAMAIAEETLTDNEKDDKIQGDKGKKERKLSDEKDYLPLPAPEIGPVPEVSQATSANSAKSEVTEKPSASTKTTTKVDQVESPKVEKID